jgi:hypothetical protein
MISFTTNVNARGHQASDPKQHLTTIYDKGTIGKLSFLKNCSKKFLPNTTPHCTITSKIASRVSVLGTTTLQMSAYYQYNVYPELKAKKIIPKI